jgi:hypothetical protein
MMMMCLLSGQHGADVNAIDHTGQTALHWSAVRGHIQVAELLLKEGAKVDAADLYGYQVCVLTYLLYTQRLSTLTLLYLSNIYRLAHLRLTSVRVCVLVLYKLT